MILHLGVPPPPVVILVGLPLGIGVLHRRIVTVSVERFRTDVDDGYHDGMLLAVEVEHSRHAVEVVFCRRGSGAEEACSRSVGVRRSRRPLIW